MHRSAVNGPARRGERGISVILFALCLTTLLGVSAFAVDLGSSRQIAHRLQSSADAASLAAAQELPLRFDGTDAAIARGVAADYTARNLHGEDATLVSVPCPSGAGAVVGNYACFESDGSFILVETPFAVSGSALAARHFMFVRTCETTPTILAGAMGLTAPRVCKDAVARRYQAGLSYGRGLLTVEPTACPGLLIRGDSDVDIVSDGGVFVDSTCSQAMEGGGSSWSLSAAVVSMVGDYEFNSCSSGSCLDADTPIATGQPPLGDPLENLPTPVRPGTEAVCTVSGDTEYCTPGAYSTFAEFAKGSIKKVTFLPGIHWFAAGVDFNNADVRIEGPTDVDPEVDADPATSTATGDGAMMYVDAGVFDLSGNGLISLTPPTTGIYQGISVFTGRSNTTTAKFTGSTGSTVGTVYIPEAKLELGGSTDWTVTGMVVAAQTELFGSMELYIDPQEPASAEPPVEDLGLEF